MLSFFPDRERYTRTWGPLLESGGVTLLLGAFIATAAYQAWPEGLNRILTVYVSTEFLWDPPLFLALCGVTFLPSLLWLILHPLIDARRIDRNPTLQKHITRHYPLLFKEAFALHAIAFTASAATALYLLPSLPTEFRMPLALAVYGVTHGLLHLLRNVFGTRFSRQSLLNLQAHLHHLLYHDPDRFEDSIRLLGALWAFHHGMPNRMSPILQGQERLNPNEILRDLDFIIHEFPPREGLISMVRAAAPDSTAQFTPVIEQLLVVLASRSARATVLGSNKELVQALTQAARQPPIQLLCACMHNYNRSPAMAAILKSFLEQKGWTAKIRVHSGGIAPIPRPNHQLLTILRKRGIAAEPQQPRPVQDQTLTQAHLVLAADVPTALTLGWRLYELEPGESYRKILLFTALDVRRFKGMAKLPDPATDRITLAESVVQIQETLEHALVPALAAATIPESLIALAGQLLRGLFPGDLPAYQAEKRTRLLLAIARNEPAYLIHVDRKTPTTHGLTTADHQLIWNDLKAFNPAFLAQLCSRFAEREQIRQQSPHAKDYASSMVALVSLLSPVIHRIDLASRSKSK